MLVAIRDREGRYSTKQLKAGKLKSGKQMRNYCIHHIGGLGAVKLTPSHRERVASKREVLLARQAVDAYCTCGCPLNLHRVCTMIILFTLRPSNMGFIRLKLKVYEMGAFSPIP